jgi:hypothetical protein
MRVFIGAFFVAIVLGVGAWKLIQTHPQFVHARAEEGLTRVECGGLSFLSPEQLTPAKPGAVPANVERQQTFACHSQNLTVLASVICYKAKLAPNAHTAAISVLANLARPAGGEKPADTVIAPTSILGLDGARFSATLARTRKPMKAVGCVLTSRLTYWTLQVVFDPQNKEAETNALRILESIQSASQRPTGR